jgi:Flp pilus assembly pilin Flp
MQRFIDTWLLPPALRLLGALNGQRGQTLAEYGLILTLIAVAVIVPTALILRNQMVAAFTSAASCLGGGC